jgi:hypothetical protein
LADLNAFILLERLSNIRRTTTYILYMYFRPPPTMTCQKKIFYLLNLHLENIDLSVPTPTPASASDVPCIEKERILNMHPWAYTLPTAPVSASDVPRLISLHLHLHLHLSLHLLAPTSASAHDVSAVLHPYHHAILQPCSHDWDTHTQLLLAPVYT